MAQPKVLVTVPYSLEKHMYSAGILQLLAGVFYNCQFKLVASVVQIFYILNFYLPVLTITKNIETYNCNYGFI